MLSVYSVDLDRRLQAFCANASTTYGWYLDATQGAENNLDIQRKIIKGSKSYATLRQDLRLGCVLPPIVLAVSIAGLDARLSDFNNPIQSSDAALLSSIATAASNVLPTNVHIIDGLQRTNAIRQVADDLDDGTRTTFLNTPLRLEIWLNIGFNAIAYRMLLLNAGQRPMSIKHQVEILSQNLKTDLQTINGLEIIDAGRRRTAPGQFQLAKLSLAFQAWLQGSPNVDVRNIVVEQMLADSAIATLGTAISTTARHNSDDFRGLVEWLAKMDIASGTKGIEFFGNETVLQGIAAAVGSSQRNEQLRARTETCLTSLLRTQELNVNLDVLGIEIFEGVRTGIDASKRNVGEATRNLVFAAFQEYFVSSGLKTMPDCWNFAGAR